MSLREKANACFTFDALPSQMFLFTDAPIVNVMSFKIVPVYDPVNQYCWITLNLPLHVFSVNCILSPNASGLTVGTHIDVFVPMFMYMPYVSFQYSIVYHDRDPVAKMQQ